MYPLISVIIPVYNLAGYLHTSLESVRAQTYQHLEILLVDDGSTDGSIESVQDLLEIDGRIKVIRQSNQGAAAARNKGIDEAQGEYIFFVDGDDTITPDAVERLYQTLQEFQAQVVVGGVAYYDAQGRESDASAFPRGVFSTKEIVEMMYTGHPALLLAAGKMIHRELLGTLRFPVGKQVEDAYFQPMLYHVAGKVALEPSLIYRYQYERPGNASTGFSVEKFENHMEAFKLNLDLFGSDPYLEDIILTRSFRARSHYLRLSAANKDKIIFKEVRQRYWEKFASLSKENKRLYLILFLKHHISFYEPLLLKRCRRSFYWRVRVPLREARINWRKVRNSERPIRSYRLPVFKESLNQLKRVGYFAHNVGVYFSLSNVRVSYIDNAKVASTSIKEALLVGSGGDLTDLFEKDIHLHFKRYFRQEIEKGEKPPYFSFVFVRNPFERVVSTYKNMYNANKVWSTFKVYLFGYFKKDRGFDYFVRKGPVRIPDRFADTHLVSQHVLVYDGQGRSYADFIGRFEHLAEDWKVVQEKAGLPDLPVRNQTAKDDWRDYYTLELAKLVYRRYQKDIEVFGYEEEYIKLKAYLEEKEKERAGI